MSMEQPTRVVSKSRVGFALGMRASFAALSFLLTLVLARSLGPQSFGEYSFLLSVFMFALLPTTSGISRFNVLEVAKSNEGSVVSRLLHAELKITAVLILLGVLFATLLFIDNGLSEELLLLATYPIAAWCAYETSILRGQGRTTLGNIDSMLLRPMFMLIAVGALFTFGITITVQITVIVFISSIVLTRIILQPFISLPSIMQILRNKKPFQLPSKQIVLLTIIGSIEVIYFHFDSLMIGFLSDNEQVGFYRISAAIKNLALMPIMAMNLFLPYVFAKYIHNNYEKVATDINSITFFNFAFLVIFAASVMVFGGELVLFIFGNDFLPVHNVVLPALVAVAFSGLFGPTVEGLLAADGGKYLVMIFAFTFPAHIAVSLYLIPSYGAWGASLAWSISHVVLFVSCGAFLHRHFSLRMGLLNFQVFDNFLRSSDK